MTIIVSSSADKIIVGSFQGFIRIYEPHPPSFAASHMILEKDLGMPIIQIGLGGFIQYVGRGWGPKLMCGR